MTNYTFLYRCPITGHKVQGIVGDKPTPDDAGIYETVTCTACARVHLINPSNGHVAGAIAIDMGQRAAPAGTRPHRVREPDQTALTA